MCSSIDMNVGVFWETSVGFLKSAVLQLFPKTFLLLPCKTLQMQLTADGSEISKIAQRAYTFILNISSESLIHFS